ncbi:MAG: carbon storage regulator [Clostridiales bacterium]|nr:carbon storage regulator [Clostridiales bacterium]
MLVISRKISESIVIGDNIEVIISDIGSDRVKICISAPKEVPIARKELLETKNVNEEANNFNPSNTAQSVNKLKELLK